MSNFNMIDRFHILLSRDILNEKAKKSLEDISNIIEDALLLGDENEQWFLDYLDELNSLSVTW